MAARSLSRFEVSQLLDLDRSVVDALLDSGRVLCHMKRGEVQIPIEQLEAFFRDSLVRLYRAEAVAPADVVVAEETSLPEPAPAQPMALHATPVEPPKNDEPELRVASRFVPLRQINGIFGDCKFTIVQMSATGLRIRHQESLIPGTEGKVSFALMRPAQSFVMRARVVWTSLAKAGEERFSISGLRVTEHVERLARAIDLLKSRHQLQPERRSTLHRADEMVTIDEIADEEIALVSQAVQKFAIDPVEAGRWYSRGRFAVSDENVRRVVSERMRDRDEILGIWEYLDRQVEIPKITGVLACMRQGAVTTAPPSPQ